MENSTFSFPDVNMEVSTSGRTCVHTKATDTELYANFKPLTPENYKDFRGEDSWSQGYQRLRNLKRFSSNSSSLNNEE